MIAKVWTFVENDWSMLEDEPRACVDLPIRECYRTREDATKACIDAIVDRYSEDGMVVTVTPDDFRQERDDLVWGSEAEGLSYRVYAMTIETA